MTEVSGSTAARGGAVTLIGQAVRFAIQISGIVVLSRVLAPSDFGLIVMVTAFIGVGDVIRDFGLANAAVQAKELSSYQKTNLFWISSTLGLLLASLGYLSTPLIADFYGEPRLVQIVPVMCLGLVFAGMQTQYQADLVRTFRYTALTVTDVLSQAIGLLCALAAVGLGFGYWALVAQVLMVQISLLAGRLISTGWVPGLYTRNQPMRSLVSYGGNLTATQVLVYISNNVDSVVVGRVLGTAALGFYSRAFQLMSMPVNQLLAPLTNVALSNLARLSDDRPRFSRFLQAGHTLVCLALSVILGTCAGIAFPTINIALGQDWSPSARIFQILCIGALFQAVGFAHFWVFLSLGLTRAHLQYSVVSRTILITSILCGSMFGIEGVAWGYSIGVAAAWPLSILWVYKVAHLSPCLLGGASIRAVAIAVVTFLACYTSTSYAAPRGDLVSIISGLSAAILIIGAIAMLVPYVRRDFGLLKRVAVSVRHS